MFCGSSVLRCVLVLHSFLWLSNIPLHGQPTCCVCIHPSVDNWAVSALSMMTVLLRACARHLWTCLRVFCYLPGAGLWGPVVILCLMVGGPARLSSVTSPSRVSPALCERSRSPHPASVCYTHLCPGRPGGCEGSPPGFWAV